MCRFQKLRLSSGSTRSFCDFLVHKMKAFVPVILLGLLLWGLSTAQFASDVQQDELYSEAEEAQSVSGSPDEPTEDSTGSTGFEESMVRTCSNITLGVSLYALDGTLLRVVLTNSTLDCCTACNNLDRCTTWSRNRDNGFCELYEVAFTRFRTPIYEESRARNFDMNDIGGFVGEEIILASFVASPTAIPPECSVTQGISYPGGTVLAQGNAQSALYCCELCRVSRDCYSWYYDMSKDRCTLNSNIPSLVNRDSTQFSGGTTLD